MIIRNIKESLLFFLSLFAITGCIRERLDDCNNISLCFTYFADGNENVFGKYIDKVNLYVFDEGGTLIRDFVYSGPIPMIFICSLRSDSLPVRMR